MKPEKILERIQALAFMRELAPALPPRVAGAFVEVSEQRKVSEGGTWIREHEHSEDKGYILLRGKVAITRSEAPDVVCEAPELLGEMMQFNPMHERTATVAAADECLVLRFFWDTFWTKLGETLSEDEVQQVRTALESQAWDHLTG